MTVPILVVSRATRSASWCLPRMRSSPHALGESVSAHASRLMADHLRDLIVRSRELAGVDPTLSTMAPISQISGAPARIGRKLAGTSGRFAPGGNAVVWGQSGIGPHSRHERPFIPSIEPHPAVLDAFAGPAG